MLISIPLIYSPYLPWFGETSPTPTHFKPGPLLSFPANSDWDSKILLTKINTRCFVVVVAVVVVVVFLVIAVIVVVMVVVVVVVMVVAVAVVLCCGSGGLGHGHGSASYPCCISYTSCHLALVLVFLLHLLSFF